VDPDGVWETFLGRLRFPSPLSPDGFENPLPSSERRFGTLLVELVGVSPGGRCEFEGEGVPSQGACRLC
jgi:hypothetical protein